MSSTYHLSCVVHGRANEWEAFCLDFDLAVQARSFDEVIDNLKVAIAAYVNTADAEPEPIRTQLLARRAPLFTRLLWRWRVAKWALRAPGTRTEESTFGFPVPCPA